MQKREEKSYHPEITIGYIFQNVLSALGLGDCCRGCPVLCSGFSGIPGLHPLADPCSVTESCSTLYHPMDCSILGSSVLHYLPELAQIYVY